MKFSYSITALQSPEKAKNYRFCRVVFSGITDKIKKSKKMMHKKPSV